ncbi:DUF4266 domain-containing protein [Oceanobacter kriegii]|uniref:DUF4266 domain-containing protein n=1 Tax=Oceanobacter kriegii TaxID=64972 RepID=UPI0003FE41B4|nr:DUF4266 domain-containing protein [Oceanobacter kriegii]
MNKGITRVAAGLLCGSLLLASGCAQVAPWQRGHLGSDVMSWDSNALKRSLDDHIHSSKEASSGGFGAAGGGCGCNG